MYILQQKETTKNIRCVSFLQQITRKLKPFARIYRQIVTKCRFLDKKVSILLGSMDSFY